MHDFFMSDFHQFSLGSFDVFVIDVDRPWNIGSSDRKDHLILTMNPEKQDKTSKLSKHWSPDSTPAKNEVIMKTTYPVN